MDRRGMSESDQRHFDTAELGRRVAAHLNIENLASRPYNPPERFVRRWPEIEDPEEVAWALLVTCWRRAGVGWWEGSDFCSGTITPRFRGPAWKGAA